MVTGLNGLRLARLPGNKNTGPPRYGLKGIVYTFQTGPPMVRGHGFNSISYSGHPEKEKAWPYGKVNPVSSFTGLKDPPRNRGTGTPVSVDHHSIVVHFVRPPCQKKPVVPEGDYQSQKKRKKNKSFFMGRGSAEVHWLTPPAIYNTGPPGFYITYVFFKLTIVRLFKWEKETIA